MTDISDQSVQLVVTSPPYWQLKDYGGASQIGYNQTYEQYINHLNLVWQECHRVLQSGCRLCINIGDQFARSVYYGRYKVIPIRTEIIKFCEAAGFDYMGAIIWQKVTTTNTTGGATIMGSFPFPRNGILKLDYEFILIFKKPGKTPKVDKSIKEQSRMTTEEWNTYFAGHWNFSGVRQQHHIAMFPPELPRRLIKMFTFVGETVLDPFLGSGTTSLVASELGRNSIGIESNPEYLPIIKEKTGLEAAQNDPGISFEIVEQQVVHTDYEEMVNMLPYQFKDPIPLNPKVDFKEMQFGSKIDKKSKQRESYFRVKKIHNLHTFTLSDGRQIRLIGIREKTGKEAAANEFLTNILKGQKVFLRFDKAVSGSDGGMHPHFCYLYLQNKTFINAHLIKKGLAEVDDSYAYRHQKRFLNYPVLDL